MANHHTNKTTKVKWMVIIFMVLSFVYLTHSAYQAMAVTYFDHLHQKKITLFTSKVDSIFKYKLQINGLECLIPYWGFENELLKTRLPNFLDLHQDSIGKYTDNIINYYISINSCDVVSKQRAVLNKLDNLLKIKLSKNKFVAFDDAKLRAMEQFKEEYARYWVCNDSVLEAYSSLIAQSYSKK